MKLTFNSLTKKQMRFSYTFIKHRSIISLAIQDTFEENSPRMLPRGETHVKT